MRKKIIVIGSFLAVFLMVMVPNVNAVEYQTKYENNELNLNKLIETNLKIDINKIKNIDYNLWEIFNILLNIYGVLLNAIQISEGSVYSILHLFFMIGHIYLLGYWIIPD